jgi:hypothetical protein
VDAPFRGSRGFIEGEKRAKRIELTLKELPVGKAFKIPREEGAWTRLWLKETYPHKKFSVSERKGEPFAIVKYVSNGITMAPEQDLRHKNKTGKK